jgi:uncharacterized protein (UPF0333 family)
MSRWSKALTGALVVAAVGVAAYYAVTTFREKKALAAETAGNIQAELDNLDPVTRAAVVAKISSDAAKDLRGKAR